MRFSSRRHRQDTRQRADALCNGHIGPRSFFGCSKAGLQNYYFRDVVHHIADSTVEELLPQMRSFSLRSTLGGRRRESSFSNSRRRFNTRLTGFYHSQKDDEFYSLQVRNRHTARDFLWEQQEPRYRRKTKTRCTFQLTKRFSRAFHATFSNSIDRFRSPRHKSRVRNRNHKNRTSS